MPMSRRGPRPVEPRRVANATPPPRTHQLPASVAAAPDPAIADTTSPGRPPRLGRHGLLAPSGTARRTALSPAPPPAPAAPPPAAPPAASRRPWGRRGLGPDGAQIEAAVTGLIAAIDARDRNAVATALAPDVLLQVPSLGFSTSGSDEVLNALGTVLNAFPDLRYRLRSRYLTPGRVIDEAILEGTPTGPLVAAAPSTRPVSVAARVMLAHDGHDVTTITVWVDGGALGDLLDLPETASGVSNPLVTALRATLPVAKSRLILGRDREATIIPRQVPPAPPPPLPPRPRPTTPRGSDLRLPVPRRTRRLRAVALALLMLAASTGVVAWVVHGTVLATTGQGVPAPPSNVAPPASPNPEVSHDSPVPVHFNSARDEYEFSSDLLFDTNSFRLTPQAQEALRTVITRIRDERRWGRITVTGYTDRRGTTAYNVRLSRKRADAVAAALRSGLLDARSRMSVVAIGRGEANPVATGTSPEALRANRRVTVHVPQPTPARP